MAYYNTTNASENDVKWREGRAWRQEDVVLSVFQRFPHLTLTPFDVQVLSGMDDVPITSIRRAISDLTDKGFLVRTEEKRMGIHGHMNYTWRLAGSAKT